MKHLFIFLIASLLLSNCMLVKPVTIEDVERIEIKKISFTQIDLVVTLPISNPNFFSFTVTELNLAIKINNVHIGNINEAVNYQIKSKSKESVDFPLTIKMKNILSGALSVFSSFSNPEADINIIGKITAKSWGITKKITVDTHSRTKITK